MLQIGRGNVEDRLFNAAKGRQNHYYHCQQSSQRPRSSAAGGVYPSTSFPVASKNKHPSPASGTPEPENRAVKNEDLPKTGSASSATTLPTAPTTGTAVPSTCNLDRFLESTTPLVPAQYPPNTTMTRLRNCDVECQPYFVLADLWESFKEWSAYGAGVPIVLNQSDSVIQYYVPYLSGIQLYVESRNSSFNSSRPCNESDGDSFRDSSSEASSDYERERALMHLRSWNPNKSPALSNLRMDGMSIREKHVNQEGSSSGVGDIQTSRGHLLFQFLEQDPPFIREPLTDKISDISKRFPLLKTLRSCDILPSSWISVAWYPIYRIPTGPTLKDLDACFLTFHSLSTAVKDICSAPNPISSHQHGADGIPRVALRCFGLASYKFKSSIWTPNGGPELQRANSMLRAADNWLHHVNVDHPDYLFFASHGSFRR